MKFVRPDKGTQWGHRFGWMTHAEADALGKLLKTIATDFKEIRFLEIGVFGGSTTSGVYETAEALGCPLYAAGVDLAQGKPPVDKYPDYHFYEGDSMDQWRNIKERFNLLFVDGCHCINHSMCDFLNYSPLVVVGGYCLFHDTAALGDCSASDQGAWPQDHSYHGLPPSSLGVRQGLLRMGLLNNLRTDWTKVWEIRESAIMGMTLFKKLKEL